MLGLKNWAAHSPLLACRQMSKKILSTQVYFCSVTLCLSLCLCLSVCLSLFIGPSICSPVHLSRHYLSKTGKDINLKWIANTKINGLLKVCKIQAFKSTKSKDRTIYVTYFDAFRPLAKALFVARDKSSGQMLLARVPKFMEFAVLILWNLRQ